MSNSYSKNGDITNIKTVQGDVNISINSTNPTPKAGKALITEDQVHTINAIAEGFGLLGLALGAPKDTAPLIKHIAFSEAGVKSIRAIPAVKYKDALQAMRKYIQKHSKSD